MTPTPDTTTINIFDKTIALAIYTSGLWLNRKVDMDGVEVDADKDSLTLNAQILRCPETAAIQGLFNDLKTRVANTKRGLALPSLFRRGVYLVPMAAVEDVDAMLREGRDRLTALVDKLIAVYDQRIEDDRVKLNVKFNLAHYPAKSALRSVFTINWRYMSMGPAQQLQTISAKLYADEVERVQTECAQLGNEIKMTLRTAAFELVNHMRERLTGVDEKSGKPKIFKQTTVTNLIQFLNTFEVRNIMQDTELSGALASMRDILSGVDVNALRTNEALRTAVAGQVDAMATTLSALVTTQTRSVVLPDDEPVVA